MQFSQAALVLLLPAILSLTTLATPLAENSLLEARSLSHHKHHHHHSSTTTSTAPAPTASSNQESLQEFENTHDSNNPEDEQTAGYIYDEQQGEGV